MVKPYDKHRKLLAQHLANGNKNKCLLWIIAFDLYNDPIKETATDRTAVGKWTKKMDQRQFTEQKTPMTSKDFHIFNVMIKKGVSFKMRNHFH